MDENSKILVLENEFQAQLLDSALTEHGIPHIICSHHDSAYDGIFQVAKGWGHVEAPEKYRDKIIALFKELAQPQSRNDDEAPQEDV
jgi:hypothetical protein